VLTEQQAVNALTVLTRLAQREPGKQELLHTALSADLANLAPLALRVGLETGEPMPSVLLDVLRTSAEGSEVAVRLAEAMPIHTVSSLDLAAEVAAAQVKTTTAGSVEHAVALVDYAQCLADLGNEEAAAAASEGVALLRLVDEKHDYLPRGLWTLARCMTQSGKHPAAVSAGREAVNLLRRRNDPGSQVRLAFALSNLAQSLSRADQDDEALTASGEAVAQFRHVLATTPRRFDYQLEDARDSGRAIWINLSPGPNSAPAPPGAFAVDVDSRALMDPSVILSGLASSLTDYARLLFFSGRVTEAEAAADEAVRHLRDLAADQPDAYTVQLSIALTWKATAVAEATPAEALVPATEAAALLRDTAAEHLNAIGSYFREALMPLTWTLMRLRQWEDALQTMLELKALWPSDDAKALGALCTQFENLSAQLAGAQEVEKALGASRAAVDVARKLAQMDDEQGSLTLASALHNLSRRQRAAGDDHAASRTSAEATRLIAGPLMAGRVGGEAATAILWQYLSAREAMDEPLDTGLPLAPVFIRAGELLGDDPQSADSLAQMAFWIGEAYRTEGDLDSAAAVLQASLGYCTSQPSERGPRVAYALAAFNLAHSLLEESRRGEAERIVENLVELAADQDPVVVRQTGRAAFIVLSNYTEEGNVTGAARVAVLADAALRSRPYLAARREELMEESPDAFLGALDRLSGTRPPPGC